jgi:class 3 adenylate cyclase/tetratricopeptide (TPR) repeat protein
VVVCPACGEENPERARFCLACGTSLVQTTEAGPREERRVVTVLFADLVGFTARSDRADPEDIAARVRPFHAALKRAVEGFGGTIEKFTGDGALAVFGKPVAHEDDPERAVRAGMVILDEVRGLNDARPELELAVRVGINTGEAVVVHGSGPQLGEETLTGDAVNTGSRLESNAPVNGILVGEATFRATREVFVFEELEPIRVKGKAEALAVWRPVEARARLGQDVTRRHTTPFTGREAERARLLDAFDGAVEERGVRLVTVLGEPGVGKSRLVAELGRHVDELPDLVVWRHGRCLPYGEGITFWALGEVLKSHAGVLDSDSPAEAAAKLDAVIPATEPDREWLLQRLAPLVGLDAPPAAREELFTAWRRFLEHVAAAQPAVLVFEDLHWADPALLELLEHVASTSRGVAMLLVGTARPELLDRHPDWAGRVPGSVTISLGPLSAEETGRLVGEMLERAALPEASRAAIVERAGGNPLYAEEFVRMLEDRGLLLGSGAGTEDLPFPDSVQALVASRLDLLGEDRRAVLQDASVIGKVFWSGAVASMGSCDVAQVASALPELVRRELVQPSPASTIEGQDEYAFWHVVVRDVAYGQMPRGRRARKHRAAAQWIEAVAAGRLEDHAEILAHHSTEALRLARAAGLQAELPQLERSALRFLLLAGDRAIGLDVAAAERHYARALELTPRGNAERPAALARWADAARQLGRPAEATAALEEAVEGFRARGDALAAARALGTLSSVLVAMGESRQEEVALEAVRLLEDAGEGGPDLVAAYARMAGVHVVTGNLAEVVEWVDRAEAAARGLGAEVPARALGFRGYVRCILGDAEGLADMRRALDRAVQRGEGRDAAVLYNNLAVAAWTAEGAASAHAILLEGIEFSERRGIAEMALAMKAGSLDVLFHLGEWDEALALADELEDQAEEAGDEADLLQIRWTQCRIRALRGDR